MTKWTYIKEEDVKKQAGKSAVTSSNFNVIGIGASTEEACLKPKDKVTISTIQLSTQTIGKLFVAIKDDDPNTPNAFGLIFNGKQVPVRKNEKAMQTNSEDAPEKGYKTYAFDVPMNVISETPKPAKFTIQFITGTIQNREFVQDGRSKEFILEVPSDAATPAAAEE